MNAVWNRDVRCWPRSAVDADVPLSPDALLASCMEGRLVDVVSQLGGWEHLLAIQLPDGINWPRHNMAGPLFIRDFYDRAWSTKLRAMSRIIGKPGISISSAAVVLGTPGIGKTAFTVYCLLRLLVARRPFRFKLCLNDLKTVNGTIDVHVNSEGVVAGGIPSAPAGYVYVHDSNTPSDESAVTADGCLLVTSPDETVWWKWRNQRAAETLHFPTHTREELRTLAWLTHCPLELVDAGMAKFGGVPRYALNAAVAGDQMRCMQEAVRGLDLDTLLRIETGSLDFVKNPTHRVFSSEVDRETLKHTGKLLIPESLVPCIMQHILESRTISAGGLIRLLELVPGACTLAGNLLEPQVLRLLPGNSFHLRQLTRDLPVPARARHLQSDAAEADTIPPLLNLRFAQQLHHVLGGSFHERIARTVHAASPEPLVHECVVPENRNEAAVDFVLSNGILCNVTLQRSHTILVDGASGAGLRALLSTCPTLIKRDGPVAYVNFVWWQLESRAAHQVQGSLVIEKKRIVDGDDAPAGIIMVSNERVHVRQFVAPIMMSEQAVRDHLYGMAATEASGAAPSSAGVAGAEGASGSVRGAAGAGDT
ncbi:MAG: hypothetical protein EOO65_02345 [Methanosarcinales archaeon]|nr:MAG: hypothetical protein EOO65_02345 [Methanosarcinales archaeon]